MGQKHAIEMPGPMQNVVADKKHGGCIEFTLPWARKYYLLAIALAEQKKGAPVNTTEVLAEMNNFTTIPKLYQGFYLYTLQDMWRNDEILCDLYGDHWSVQQPAPEGLETYSDRYARIFEADYTLDPKREYVLCPRPHACINFQFLKDLLLSKNLDRVGLLREIGTKHKFLDSAFDMSGNRICFTSYPRSGNTFLRTFIEQCTGIYTGSDLSLHIILTMQMSGMPGEQRHGDDSVWITKTHYPLTNDKFEHKADKIIYLARNPTEIFPSYAGLLTTAAHSLVPERPWNEYKQFWEFFVDWQSKLMAHYFENLKKQAQKTPTYFIRYEDLRLNPETVLRELFCFMLDVDSIDGTVLEMRLKEVCSTDNTTKTKYALKSTSTNLSRNRGLYNAEQWEMLSTRLKSHNYFWGYANMDIPEEFNKENAPAKNPTAFFEYDQHSAVDMNQFMRYRELNQDLPLKKRNPYSKDLMLPNSNIQHEQWHVNKESPLMPHTQFVGFALNFPHDLRMTTPKEKAQKAAAEAEKAVVENSQLKQAKEAAEVKEPEQEEESKQPESQLIE